MGINLGLKALEAQLGTSKTLELHHFLFLSAVCARKGSMSDASAGSSWRRKEPGGGFALATLQTQSTQPEGENKFHNSAKGNAPLNLVPARLHEEPAPSASDSASLRQERQPDQQFRKRTAFSSTADRSGATYSTATCSSTMPPTALSSHSFLGNDALTLQLQQNMHSSARVSRIAELSGHAAFVSSSHLADGTRPTFAISVTGQVPPADQQHAPPSVLHLSPASLAAAGPRSGTEQAGIFPAAAGSYRSTKTSPSPIISTFLQGNQFPAPHQPFQQPSPEHSSPFRRGSSTSSSLGASSRLSSAGSSFVQGGAFPVNWGSLGNSSAFTPSSASQSLRSSASFSLGEPSPMAQNSVKVRPGGGMRRVAVSTAAMMMPTIPATSAQDALSGNAGDHCERTQSSSSSSGSLLPERVSAEARPRRSSRLEEQVRIQTATENWVSPARVASDIPSDSESEKHFA